MSKIASIMGYRYLTEFLAYEVVYDTLTSQPIPEKVNALEWLNLYKAKQPHILTANEKFIKLYKIKAQKEKKIESAQKILKKANKIQFPRSKVTSES